MNVRRKESEECDTDHEQHAQKLRCLPVKGPVFVISSRASSAGGTCRALRHDRCVGFRAFQSTRPPFCRSWAAAVSNGQNRDSPPGLAASGPAPPKSCSEKRAKVDRRLVLLV